MALAVMAVVVVAVAVIVYYGGEWSPPTRRGPHTTTTITTAVPRAPFGAVCVDGSSWWGQHRNGACARHGGVREWLDLHAG